MNNDSFTDTNTPPYYTHTRPSKTHACTHRDIDDKENKKEKKKEQLQREGKIEPTRGTPTPNTCVVCSENTQIPQKKARETKKKKDRAKSNIQEREQSRPSLNPPKELPTLHVRERTQLQKGDTEGQPT